MTPPILWTPPDELLQRATMAKYMRERGFSTYADLQRWSVEDLDGFWGSIWDRFEVGERGETVLGSRSMPGATWFPGTSVNYAEHAFRGRADDAPALIAGGEDRDDVEWTWGELRSLTARIASRAAGAGRRARRPRRRLHAEHPRDRRRVPGVRVAGRGLVLLLAGLRRAVGDRPLRADRAEGAAGGAHVPLQRARVRPLARRWTAIVGEMPGVADGRARRGELGRADRRRGRAGVRARAVRPPALGPLLERDDRAAEGDRAVPGRHPARAPEDAAPAPGRAGGRPAVLVHDDRLDDVELHRLRAADRGDRAALRRLARASVAGRAVGLRGADADDDVRDQRVLHRRVHEGGRRARGRPRPVGAEGGRLDGLAAVARGVSLGL